MSVPPSSSSPTPSNPPAGSSGSFSVPSGPPPDPPAGVPSAAAADARLAGMGPEAPAGGLAGLLAGARGRPWYKPLSRVPALTWRLGMGPLIGRAFALVTTTGRRTGLRRTTMVGYVAAGERMYVAALYGPRSQWFRNVVADPRVSVQTAGRSRAMLAHRLTTDDEVRRAYHDLEDRVGGRVLEVALRGLGVPGGLDGLLAHRDSLVLVRLSPTGLGAPPAARPDLFWVLPLAAGWWWLRRRRRGRRG